MISNKFVRSFIINNRDTLLDQFKEVYRLAAEWPKADEVEFILTMDGDGRLDISQAAADTVSSAEETGDRVTLGWHPSFDILDDGDSVYESEEERIRLRDESIQLYSGEFAKEMYEALCEEYKIKLH